MTDTAPICPRCGARVTPARAKTYWAVAVGLKSQGLDIRVETECCHNTLTLEQVKALRWGRAKSAAAWGRKLSAARKTFGAGTGRPTVEKPCPFCGEKFTARKLREHKPRCPKKPS
jgi:hypothetical protein